MGSVILVGETMTKRKCSCNVCKCESEPIDNQVVNSHLRKYEQFRERTPESSPHKSFHVIDESSSEIDAIQIAAIPGS